MLLVQQVRITDVFIRELHAQVRPAMHCFHEIVRLPSDTAHTAKLYKKIVGCSA